MRILGLDIGGANIKAVCLDTSSFGKDVCVHRFALWKEPGRLAEELAGVTRPFAWNQSAVTMTGELCDCFETKAQGVSTILDAVEETLAGERAVWVLQTTGQFVSPTQARCDPWASAASNWLALATFAATRQAPTGPSLLIDVGSTTTDIIPICQGRVVARGRNDPERLSSGELVYHGIERTPICAVLSAIELGEQRYTTMAELFATALDAYLLLGQLPEDPIRCDTADARPATREYAIDRLARMIGSDRTRFDNDDARAVASAVRDKQLADLSLAVDQVAGQSLSGRVEQVISSGQGEFLVEMLIHRHPLLQAARHISLTAELGPLVSRAACAFAVAALLAARA